MPITQQRYPQPQQPPPIEVPVIIEPLEHTYYDPITGEIACSYSGRNLEAMDALYPHLSRIPGEHDGREFLIRGGVKERKPPPERAIRPLAELAAEALARINKAGFDKQLLRVIAALSAGTMPTTEAELLSWLANAWLNAGLPIVDVRTAALTDIDNSRNENQLSKAEIDFNEALSRL